MVDARAVEEWLKAHPKREFHEGLFGSASPSSVTSFIVDAVTEIEQVAVESIFEYQVGLVASACVALRDSTRIFVKIYPDSFEEWDVLIAARQVQAELCASGLAVPSPRRIERIKSAYVATDEYLPGAVKDCRAGERRQVMAKALAVLIDAAPPVGVHAGLERSRLHMHPKVPPQTGDPEDFAEALLHYAAVLDSRESTPVVAHLDWRVQNVAWNTDEIAAIYDWDSVAISSEAAAVGAAAGMFSYDFRDPVPHVPTPAEVEGFISDYEGTRQIDTKAARAAAALKMFGYGSWEHRLDPTGSRLGERSYRSALRGSSDEYRQVFEG